MDSGLISLLKLALKAMRDYPRVSQLRQDECGHWRFVRHPKGIYEDDDQWEDEYPFFFHDYRPIAQWLGKQELIAETAWKLYRQNGVRHGFAAMMDHPCEPAFLANVGRTVDEAVDITIANAARWYTDTSLPHGWKKVYVCQGWELNDYERCLEAFEHYGILEEIRQGRAWLAAGTTCMRRPDQKDGPGLYDVYAHIRSILGVEGHLHGLGLAQPKWIRYMRAKKWIQSADSGTASLTVAFNRGPFAIYGKRTKAHLSGQFVNTMLWLEKEIMAGADAPDTAKGEVVDD